MNQNNNIFAGTDESSRLNFNGQLTANTPPVNYWVLPDGRKVVLNDGPRNTNVSSTNVNDYSRKLNESVPDPNNSIHLTYNKGKHVTNNGNNANVNGLTPTPTLTPTSSASVPTTKNNNSSFMTDFHVSEKVIFPNDNTSNRQVSLTNSSLCGVNGFNRIHSGGMNIRNVNDSKYVPNGLSNCNYSASATNENTMQNNMTNWPNNFTAAPSTHVQKDISQHRNVTNVDHINSMSHFTRVDKQNNNGFFVMQKQTADTKSDGHFCVNLNKINPVELNMQAEHKNMAKQNMNGNNNTFGNFSNAHNVRILNNSNHLNGSAHMDLPSSANRPGNMNRQTNMNITSNMNVTTNMSNYNVIPPPSHASNISLNENETHNIRMKNSKEHFLYNSFSDAKTIGVPSGDMNVSLMHNPSTASIINRAEVNNEVIPNMVVFHGNSTNGAELSMGNSENFNRTQAGKLRVDPDSINPSSSFHMNNPNGSNNVVNRNHMGVINGLDGVTHFNAMNPNAQAPRNAMEGNFLPNVSNGRTINETNRALQENYRQFMINKSTDALNSPHLNKTNANNNNNNRNSNINNNSSNSNLNNNSSNNNNNNNSNNNNINNNGNNNNNNNNNNIINNDSNHNSNNNNKNTNMNNSGSDRRDINGLNTAVKLNQMKNSSGGIYSGNARQEVNNIGMNSFNLNDRNMRGVTSNGMGINDANLKGTVGMDNMIHLNNVRNGNVISNSNAFHNEVKSTGDLRPYTSSELNQLMSSSQTMYNVPVYYKNVNQPMKDGVYTNVQPGDKLGNEHNMELNTTQKVPILRREEFPNSIPTGMSNNMTNNVMSIIQGNMTNNMSNLMPNMMQNNISNYMSNNMANNMTPASPNTTPGNMQSNLRNEYNSMNNYTLKQERYNMDSANLDRMNVGKNGNYHEIASFPRSNTSCPPQNKPMQQNAGAQMVAPSIFLNKQNINMMRNYNPNYVNNNVNQIMQNVGGTNRMVSLPLSWQANGSKQDVQKSLYEGEPSTYNRIDVMNLNKDALTSVNIYSKNEGTKKEKVNNSEKKSNRGRAKTQQVVKSNDYLFSNEASESVSMHRELNPGACVNVMATNKDKVVKGKTKASGGAAKTPRRRSSKGMVGMELSVGNINNNNGISDRQGSEVNNVLHRSQSHLKQMPLLSNGHSSTMEAVDAILMKGGNKINTVYNQPGTSYNEVLNNMKGKINPNHSNNINYMTDGNNFNGVNTINNSNSHRSWNTLNVMESANTMDGLITSNASLNGSEGNAIMVANKRDILNVSHPIMNMNLNNVKNEEMKKNEQPENTQHKVDSKFIWLFLKKKFSEDKDKYMSILPTVKEYYPNKLNELIFLLEKMNLLTFGYILKCSIELQAKYMESKNVALKNNDDGSMNGINMNNAWLGINNNFSITANVAKEVNNSNMENCNSGYREVMKSFVNRGDERKTNYGSSKENNIYVLDMSQNKENINNVNGEVPFKTSKRKNSLGCEQICNEKKMKILKSEMENDGHYSNVNGYAPDYMKAMSVSEHNLITPIGKTANGENVQNIYGGMQLPLDKKMFENVSNYNIALSNTTAHGNKVQVLNGNLTNTASTITSQENAVLKQTGSVTSQDNVSVQYRSSATTGKEALYQQNNMIEEPWSRRNFVNPQKQENTNSTSFDVQNYVTNMQNENCKKKNMQTITNISQNPGRNWDQGNNWNGVERCMTPCSVTNANEQNMSNQGFLMSENRFLIRSLNMIDKYKSRGKKKTNLADTVLNNNSLLWDRSQQMNNDVTGAASRDSIKEMIKEETESGTGTVDRIVDGHRTFDVTNQTMEHLKPVGVKDAKNINKKNDLSVGQKPISEEIDVGKPLQNEGIFAEENKTEVSKTLTVDEDFMNKTQSDAIVKTAEDFKSVEKSTGVVVEDGINNKLKEHQGNNAYCDEKTEESVGNIENVFFSTEKGGHNNVWNNVEIERHGQKENVRDINKAFGNWAVVDSTGKKADAKDMENEETIGIKKNLKNKLESDREKKKGIITVGKDFMEQEKKENRKKMKPRKGLMGDMNHLIPYRNVYKENFNTGCNRINACGSMYLNFNKRNRVMHGYYANKNYNLNNLSSLGSPLVKRNKIANRYNYPVQELSPYQVPSLHSSYLEDTHVNELATPEKLKAKYKSFHFCINKVFNSNSMNDIIALNENINKNKDLLPLFNKNDLLHLKERNFYFFMDTLNFMKIDFLIMKRIKIFMGHLSGVLGISYEIRNVEEILTILKKAFENRIKVMWPLIKFANMYRLDQFFHLLGKHRFHINSKLKDVQLVAKQNTNSLIAYFNQRILDDQLVEHMKNQLRLKKKKKKAKQKIGDLFLEEGGGTRCNLLDSWSSAFYGGMMDNSENMENAKMKANEFAFIGYNQKRLLTQITPHDYKTVLNFDFCKSFFSANWKTQQELFINSLHFDMTPDTLATRDHFENLYKRYMGYMKDEILVRSINKKKQEKKDKRAEDKNKQLKSKKKGAKKRNAANVFRSSGVALKKPRKKYTKTKLKKGDVENYNTAEGIRAKEGGTNEEVGKERAVIEELVRIDKNETVDMLGGIDADRNVDRCDKQEKNTKGDVERDKEIETKN